MTKPKHAPPDPPILPTAEQQTQGEYRLEATGPRLGAPMRARRLDGSELDRLYTKGFLSEAEHTTLSRFAESLRSAGMVFSVRSSMEPSSTSSNAMFAGDIAFARMRRIHGHMDALGAELGPVNRGIIISMLTTEQPVSKDFIPTLKRGVEILDRVYQGA